MKQEFLDFLNALIAAAPDVAEKLMTDNIKSYIEALSDKKNEKPVITKNGGLILKYLQGQERRAYSSKEIAEGMYTSSRTVSGSIRKLASDGFCEKIADSSPAMYIITDKGLNFNID